MKKSNLGIFNNSKIIKLNLVPVLGKSSIRGISALGTEAIHNTLSSVITKLKPGKLSQVVAPGLVLIGIAGELCLKNQYLSAVAQGMSSEGYRQVGHTYIPAAVKTKMNLSGLSAAIQDRKTTQEEVTEANNEMIAQELKSRGKGSGKTSTDKLN